jgi:outer membrane protein assembly factor BamA
MNNYLMYLIITCLVWSFSHTKAENLISASEDVVELSESAPKLDTQAKGSWVPVPIPVANPTVGTGLIGAVLYLHPTSTQNPDEPAAMSGAGVLYTDSDSWFIGAFHDDYWLNDRLRFKAAVGTGNFNLKYYGIGSDSIFKQYPVDYNIRPNISQLQLLVRLSANSNWFLGARHLFTSGEITFKFSQFWDLLPDVSGVLTTSSLGGVASYDSRNNTLYPTSGQFFEAVYSRDDSAWGSDFEFNKLSAFYNYYFDLADGITLATRGFVSSADGNAPFYMLPTLNMRGFATGRYQDKAAVSGHLEWRHKFRPRWGYVVFTEFGSTGSSVGNAFNKKPVKTIGAGIRWQAVASKSLNLGIDFAFSDDDQALHIQVGERF